MSLPTEECQDAEVQKCRDDFRLGQGEPGALPVLCELDAGHDGVHRWENVTWKPLEGEDAERFRVIPEAEMAVHGYSEQEYSEVSDVGYFDALEESVQLIREALGAKDGEEVADAALRVVSELEEANAKLDGLTLRAGHLDAEGAAFRASAVESAAMRDQLKIDLDIAKTFEKARKEHMQSLEKRLEEAVRENERLRRAAHEAIHVNAPGGFARRLRGRLEVWRDGLTAMKNVLDGYGER